MSGFKIKRDGYGSLEWQQPVDVRGLDLEGVVQIERGGLCVHIRIAAVQLTCMNAAADGLGESVTAIQCIAATCF